MTQHGPCGCDHEEEKEEHACCGGGHCHDDKKDAAEDHCGCGHDHGHAHEFSPEELQKLKDAIAEAGYQIEETPEGEIRILEK